MDRRKYLKGTATAAVALSAGGCLSVGPFSSSGPADNAVLDKPDRYDELRESRDSENGLEYPIHGDPLPEATVQAPLHDRELSTREFVGERHTLFTFIFTRCPSACQLLTDALRHVQSDSLDADYADDVALVPVTFDPGHDTADVLRSHGNRHGVVWDAGNWYYLRPDGHDRAKTIVEDSFGVGFERLSDEDREQLDLSDEMLFNHLSVIFLANKDGYIERTYTGANAQASPVNVLDGINTLRNRW